MSLLSLAMILPLLTTTAFGQLLRPKKSPPLSVPDAIKALQDAKEYDRSGARMDLVDAIQAVIGAQGAQVVEPVSAIVQNRYTAKDMDFVVNCILVLGDVKSKESTNLLISVLSDTNMEYAYQAAVALGDIWSGAPAGTAELPAVNAALLALADSDLPPAIVYGPGLAVIKINKLPVADPTKLSGDELLAQLDAWALSAPPDLLPAMDQRPWQVLLRLALGGSDPAVQALKAKRELGVVEPILSRLAAGKAGNAAPQLTQLMGELSGVPYPPAGAAADATPKQLTDAWRKLWLNALKTKTDDKSVQCSWQALENALRFYTVAPDEATADKIAGYYGALLYQLPGPAGIPAGASPEARKLLAGTLAIKEQMAKAVATMEAPPTDFDKGDAVRKLDQLSGEPSGVTIARQFLPRIVAVARKEPNLKLASQLGDVLWRVAAWPLTLNGATVQDREKQIDSWLGDVRKTKPELGL
jgi:hypothetical protein